MIFYLLFWPGLLQAQEVATVDQMVRGGTLDLPADFTFDNVNIEKRLAIYKFVDRETQSQCSMFLTGSESRVTLRRASSWTVTSVQPTQASGEFCRQERRDQMRSDYQRALQTFDQDWLTESPVSRSLQKRRAMEQYLRRTDQLQASRSPCTEFLVPGEPKTTGPVLVTLQSPAHQGRELKVFCDKKKVPLVALNNQGLGVMAKPLARMPASAPSTYRPIGTGSTAGAR